MCGTEAAFAAFLEDTSVVTWGHVRLGGDRCELPHQLQNVRKIFANQDAFAALLKNGSVVTWSSPAHGGDSSGIQSIQQIMILILLPF